jgi:hypothetical protein
MLPALEGDSLAVGMQPYLAARPFDAQVGRTTEEGVARLGHMHLHGRTVYVSLGTNDPGHSAAWMSRQVRRVLAMGPRLVVWGEIRVEGKSYDDTLNRGLKRVKSSRLRLVRAVRPGAGDGIHLTREGYRLRAARFRQATKG